MLVMALYFYNKNKSIQLSHHIGSAGSMKLYMEVGGYIISFVTI